LFNPDKTSCSGLEEIEETAGDRFRGEEIGR
jgi:hypothetical protein